MGVFENLMLLIGGATALVAAFVVLEERILKALRLSRQIFKEVPGRLKKI